MNFLLDFLVAGRSLGGDGEEDGEDGGGGSSVGMLMLSLALLVWGS